MTGKELPAVASSQVKSLSRQCLLLNMLQRVADCPLSQRLRDALRQQLAFEPGLPHGPKSQPRLHPSFRIGAIIKIPEIAQTANRLFHQPARRPLAQQKALNLSRRTIETGEITDRALKPLF